MSPPYRRIRNVLIEAFSPEDRASLDPEFSEVVLEAGDVLYEPGDLIGRLYFPHVGSVSLLIAAGDGSVIESAMVGWEGVAGLGGFLCGEVSFTRHVIQVPGAASVIAMKPFHRVWEKSLSLRRVLHAQRDAFAAHLLQSLTCNAAHAFERRWARWLLTCADRSEADELFFTHESMASIHGVRRATVSVAAKALQDSGVIDYQRGRITLLDRARLEAAACPCYRIIAENYERVIAHGFKCT